MRDINFYVTAVSCLDMMSLSSPCNFFLFDSSDSPLSIHHSCPIESSCCVVDYKSMPLVPRKTDSGAANTKSAEDGSKAGGLFCHLISSCIDSTVLIVSCFELMSVSFRFRCCHWYWQYDSRCHCLHCIHCIHCIHRIGRIGRSASFDLTRFKTGIKMERGTSEGVGSFVESSV